MRILSMCCLAAVLTAAATAPAADDFAAARTQNWHQWRGPQANGVAPQGDPVTTWDENTNIRWKIKVPGDSTATPIVWKDQVFVLTAIETDRLGEAPESANRPAAAGGAAAGRGRGMMGVQKPKNVYQFKIMCVDRRTGAMRWQHTAREEMPHEGHHPDGSFAAASPMTDGQRLYAFFGSRGIYCYDLDGKPLWQRDLGKMTIFNSFGEATSPVVHGDSVIVNWDHQEGSFITALDAATGETRWKVDRDEKTTWATPLVVDYNGVTQVITNGIKRVRSYDLKSGEVLWECGGQVSAAIPSPVSDGKLAYAMTGYMGYALYAIPLDVRGDVTGSDKIAWHRKEGTPYVPSPLLYGDLLYFTQGNSAIMSCLKTSDGEPLIDRTRLQGLSNVYASPVGAADRVYITGRDGTTVVLKKGAELEILATNKLDDHFDASAAIVGKEIFLRGKQNLYCIAAD